MKSNISIVSGTGDKIIVLLHYFGGAAASWKWVTDILQYRYTCVAINLPGFGEVPIHDQPSIEFFSSIVQKALTDLNIREYTLVGHSMGGKIAAHLAASKHEAGRVQQLILLAPSPPTIERMPPEEKTRMLVHPDEQTEMETVSKVAVKHLTDEKFQLAVHTQHIIDEQVWKWWLMEGMNTSIEEEAKKIVVPVTVLTSLDDPSIPPKMVNEEVMPSLPPATRLITTTGIGHLYPLEDPGWVAAMVNESVSGA